MNLRPRPSSLRGRAAALGQRVAPLTRRIREPELAWLAACGPTHGAEDALRTAASAVVASIEDRRRADEAEAELRRDAEARGADAVAARVVGWADRAAWRAGDLDVEALAERIADQREQAATRLEVAAEVLGDALVEREHEPDLEALALEALVRIVVGEARLATRLAAARGLSAAAIAHPTRVGSLGAALAVLDDPRANPWVRRALIGLAVADPDPGRLTRLAREGEGDESYLIRAAAVEEGLEHLKLQPGDLLDRVNDPSETVRFTLAGALARHPGAAAGTGLRRLARHPDPRTRARVAVACARRPAAGVVARLLDDEDRGVVGHTVDVCAQWARTGLDLAAHVRGRLERLRDGDDPSLARRAAVALAWEAQKRHPCAALAATLDTLRPGQSRTVRLPDGADAHDLAVALAPYAVEGWGFVLDPARGGRVWVFRGERRRVRLWRMIHEIRHPSPSKRQSVSHLVGRDNPGPIRVPPLRLAEESWTGVPGERLRIEREDGWAPVVPMVDDALDTLAWGPITVVTVEGTSVVTPPARPLGVRALLARDYGALDASRSASVADPDPDGRGRYVQRLRHLGFDVQAETYGPWRPYFRSFLGGLLTVRSDDLGLLFASVSLLFTILLVQAAVATQAIVAARRQIPLVLGGWGTRGKSGTERLKAAVLAGRGVPFVAKTTGCEAMLLHAPPGGRAVELFLYRPYDKATIWEQGFVVRLAPPLGARAFLWECMALNPLYVDLLQGRWMRDDLATITNAYPDHEDIQGPTGLDVATVIGGFAPPGGTLVTTEENMLPVLVEEARQRDTLVRPIRRADRELVPVDLTDRFPHVEHPANIALATAVASELGVPPIEAVGWMAEQVVPDLGALSISPWARTDHRDVQFANGMSANDTLSFRYNWRRCGFRDHDHVAEPDTWLITVVNNRADRVARSRVFAEVVANDAAAHRHVLIGTNTTGFAQFYREALDRRLSLFELGERSARELLWEHLRVVDPIRLAIACATRLGASGEAVDHALRALQSARPVATPTDAEGLRAAAEATREPAKTLEWACPGAEGLADAIVDATWRALARSVALDADGPTCAALYLAVALETLIVLQDDQATGDQIIARAIHAAPPGSRVRIMGVQNIKGTGLDFAYQWVYWREAAAALTRLERAGEAPARLDAVRALEGNPWGSVLAIDGALGRLDAFRADGDVGARVTALAARIEDKRAHLLAARTAARAGRDAFDVVLDAIERLWDPFDAVLRRARADTIFRRLTAHRISHTRAQAELQRLTNRQKGGWLRKRLRK